MKFPLFLALLFGSLAYGQGISFYVKPVETDAGYDADEDSSYVVVNPTTPVNRLILFFGGSGSSPDAYNGFLDHMGDEGFHVISLSYLNSVTAWSLKDDPDPNAYSNYRQELCFGTPLSPDVDIDTLNSIVTRITKLINFLDVNYPTDNWNQYLTASNEINWSNIAICGHSQGSGHAGYIAKFYAVERVAMFSGPNDYSDYYTSPGDWLVDDGVTPLYRYFSYLSLLDEAVPYSKQLNNIQTFGLLAHGDTIHVDVNSPPYGNSHALYTTQPKGFSLLFHNTTTKNSSLNHIVWDYIFNTTNLGIKEAEIRLEIYPNPSKNGVFQIKGANQLEDAIIVNIHGEVILTLHNTTNVIDLSDLPSGIYFLKHRLGVEKFILSH